MILLAHLLEYSVDRGGWQLFAALPLSLFLFLVLVSRNLGIIEGIKRERKWRMYASSRFPLMAIKTDGKKMKADAMAMVNRRTKSRL